MFVEYRVGSHTSYSGNFGAILVTNRNGFLLVLWLTLWSIYFYNMYGPLPFWLYI